MGLYQCEQRAHSSDEEFMSITEASVLVLEEWPSSQWFEDDEAR